MRPDQLRLGETTTSTTASHTAPSVPSPKNTLSYTRIRACRVTGVSNTFSGNASARGECDMTTVCQSLRPRAPRLTPVKRCGGGFATDVPMLLPDSGITWLGTSALVRAPDGDTARTVLTPGAYAARRGPQLAVRRAPVMKPTRIPVADPLWDAARLRHHGAGRVVGRLACTTASAPAVVLMGLR